MVCVYYINNQIEPTNCLSRSYCQLPLNALHFVLQLLRVFRNQVYTEDNLK